MIRRNPTRIELKLEDIQASFSLHISGRLVGFTIIHNLVSVFSGKIEHMYNSDTVTFP